MDIFGLILTALVLACLGLIALFGYLLLTSRVSMRRSALRREQSESDRID